VERGHGLTILHCRFTHGPNRYVICLCALAYCRLSDDFGLMPGADFDNSPVLMMIQFLLGDAEHDWRRGDTACAHN